MVRCELYHPKTQGKVQCSHRILRPKNNNDMARKKKHRINWAKQLRKYVRCLNNEKMWRTGMEIPFLSILWRKPNELVNARSACDGLITTTEVQQLTISDHNLHLKKTQTWKENTESASDRLDEQMISHAKKHPYKLHEIGDKIYVRCKKEKGKEKLTKHIIKLRLIIKKCWDDTNHNVRMPWSPINEKGRTEDLGDCMWEKHSISHPVLTPATHEEQLWGISEQGYKVLYDPPANRWKLSVFCGYICIKEPINI